MSHGSALPDQASGPCEGQNVSGKIQARATGPALPCSSSKAGLRIISRGLSVVCAARMCDGPNLLGNSLLCSVRHHQNVASHDVCM